MSLGFYPGKYEAANSIGWVFPKTITEEYLAWPDDPYEDPTPNPAYRPELDLSLASANMRVIYDHLGIEIDAATEIDQFIGVATSWLQQHIDRPSKPIEAIVETVVTTRLRSDGNVTHIDRQHGPTFHLGGLPEGYVNDKVRRMLVIAREGKAFGATVVYAA